MYHYLRIRVSVRRRDAMAIARRDRELVVDTVKVACKIVCESGALTRDD